MHKQFKEPPEVRLTIRGMSQLRDCLKRMIAASKDADAKALAAIALLVGLAPGASNQAIVDAVESAVVTAARAKKEGA